MRKKYNSEVDLLLDLEKIKGKPFSDFDEAYVSDSKGGVGHFVEEHIFGYEPNSRSTPDIEELGIEIKATPFIINKKSKLKKAKERLVLNIINYMTENLESFYESHFWYKNKRLLIMFYEHNLNIPKSMWYIDDFILFTWPDDDLHIIIQDWKKIVGKIKSGQADMLSESDTIYLAACTKGATAETSFRNQPFSNVKAKQRAYSLKPSYMTYILNNYINKNDNREKIIHSNLINENKTFEQYLYDMINPYIGKNQNDLINELGIKPSKRTNNSIINAIFKLKKDISQTQEFQKANIKVKTIRIEKDGNIREHMSFKTFDFVTLVDQKWDESDFYKDIAQTKFLFIMFKKIDDLDENSYLKDVKLWQMPEEDVMEAQKCWEKTKQIIERGVCLKPTPKKVINDLPKYHENKVAHVRPHASKAAYLISGKQIGDLSNANILPNGDWMTKQCFWLNRDYIKQIIESTDSMRNT